MTGLAAERPVEPEAAAVARPLWRQSLALIRRNKRTLLMPLLAIQIPVSLAVSAAWIVLLLNVFPDAAVDERNFFFNEDVPLGLTFWVFGLGAAWGLFSSVGLAATAVAARALAEGRTIRVVDALDPAFTRMGSLFLLCAILYGVLTIGAVLSILVVAPAIALYALLRFGLAFPFIALDGQTATRAMGMSWRLLSRNLLRYLVVLLSVIPVGAISYLAALIVFAIVTAPFLPADPGRDATVVIGGSGFVAMGIAFVPTGAFLATITTLFYLNLRKAEHARGTL